MATKTKKSKSESGEEIVEVEVEEFEPTELTALRAELGDQDYSVRCYRQAEDGGAKDDRFPTVSLDCFDVDAVVRQYGGGEWKFIVVDGNNKVRKHFRASYSKQIKPVKENDVKPAPPAADPTFLMFQQMQQNQMTMMLEMQKGTQMMMAEIAKALAGGNAKGGGLTELVTSLAALKKLEPEKDDTSAELLKTMLSFQVKSMEMGREAAESIEPEGRIAEMVEKFLPSVLEAIKTQNRFVPPQGAPIRRRKPAEDHAAASETPQPAPAAAPRAAADKYPLVEAHLSSMKGNLVQCAKGNIDVNTVALEFLHFLPRESDDEVTSFCEDPEAVDIVLRHVPELDAYTPWVRELLKALLNQYEDVPEAPIEAEVVASTTDSPGEAGSSPVASPDPAESAAPAPEAPDASREPAPAG